MKKLLEFLNRLEAQKIHYRLSHHRADFIMVEVAVPGERWEVEFSERGAVEIEVFGRADGVFSDAVQLEDIFIIDTGVGCSLQIDLVQGVDSEAFQEEYLAIIEPLGFATGGNVLSADGAFLTLYERGNMSEELRRKLDDKLSTNKRISQYRLGQLNSD